MSVYSSGAWTPNPGREDAFVEAWSEFAAWSTEWPGAGQLRLTRVVDDEGRYVSFGDWASEGELRAWKTSPEFKERLAQVLQHVGEFNSTTLHLIATAENG